MHQHVQYPCLKGKSSSSLIGEIFIPSSAPFPHHLKTFPTPFKMTTASKTDVVDTEVNCVVMGLQVPVVTWWKRRGLRKLYLMMPILMLCATVNGYDGSLLNGLQTMIPWENCENFPISSSKVGLTANGLQQSKRL